MSRRECGTRAGASLSRDNDARPNAAVYSTFEKLAGQALASDSELDRRIDIHGLTEGQRLFAAGSVDRRVHVVLDGFLTLRYTSPAGISWIKGFVPPRIPFACVSCLDGLEAHFDAHAGREATVASIPFRTLDRLASESSPWQRALLNAFKLYGQRKEKRERELLLLPPQARYLAFLEEMPEIASRLKQHEIANYVRVTPVTLSRIRRRLQLTPAGRAIATSSENR